MNIETLNEDVIVAGTYKNKITQVLIKYLTKINIDSELIIVDPYFLAPTKITNYLDLIESILISFLSPINTLRIITNASKIDTALKAQIVAKLKFHKASLHIIFTTTNDLHDRYWILSNREKGLVMGTSVNGLGNKFALVGRLNTSDVREIIKELDSMGLI